MKSLPRVIRPGRLVATEGVVKIPDAPPPTPIVPEESILPDDTEPDLPVAGSSPQDILGGNAAERATDVSQKILQRARNEREEILEQARTDAQRLREEARQEAYQQVLQEKSEEIRGSLLEVNYLLEELQQQHRSFLEEYEKGLLSIALDITKKILGTSIPEHEELMLPLVKDAVNTVKNASWIDVRISERLPHLVEMLKLEYAQYQGPGTVEITATDVPKDTCIINTPEGIIDATASVQIENLRTQLERNHG